MEVGFSSNPAESQKQIIQQINFGNFFAGHSQFVQQVQPKECYNHNYRPGVYPVDLHRSFEAKARIEGETTLDVWKLPLTVTTLQRHINITKLSQITLPDDFKYKFTDLKVSRYRWGSRAQESTVCFAKEVKISPKTLIIYHSKSLDKGIPQYFVVFGPKPNWTPYEVQLTRACRENGEDEIHLDIKPIHPPLCLDVGSDRYLTVSEFHCTLKPRYNLTFNNPNINPNFGFNNPAPAAPATVTVAPILATPPPTIFIPTFASNTLNIHANLTKPTPSRRRKQAVKSIPALSSPTSRATPVNKASNNKSKSRGPRAPVYVDISGEDIEPLEAITATTFPTYKRQAPSRTETGQPSENSSSTSLSISGFEATSKPAMSSIPNHTRMDIVQQDVEFSPEDVIKKIQQMVGNSLPNTHFVTIPCDYIRVGAYKVLTEHQEDGRKLMATVSTEGIFFELPHRQKEVNKECVIVLNHVRRVEGHLSKNLPILFITVDAKHANWLRENLGMTENDFCMDESELCVILKLTSEDFATMYTTIIKRSLPLLEEITVESATSKLLEASAKSNQGAKRRKDDSSPVPSLEENGLAPPRKLRKTGEHCEIFEESPAFDPYSGELHKLLRRHNLELSNADLMSLGGEQFINDQIIDYWLQEVHSRLSEPLKNRTHIFSTFFYRRLSTPVKKKSYSFETDVNMPLPQRKHQRVKKWTKKLDLFSKDFIVVPVNEEAHWFLAIICYPGLDGPHSYDELEKLEWHNIRLSVIEDQGKILGTVPKGLSEKFRTAKDLEDYPRPRMKQPCIFLFDSLPMGDDHKSVYRNLRDYLDVEYQEKKGAKRTFDMYTIPGFQPKVPPQPNNCDCGIFLLKYVEAFFDNPIYSFAIPMKSMEDWFPSSIVQTKRQEIYDSIVELVKSEAPEKVVFIPQLQFSRKIDHSAAENDLPADDKQKGPPAEDAQSADAEEELVSSQSTEPRDEEHETTEMEETTEASTGSDNSAD